MFDAPENKLTWKHAAPKASRWGIGDTKLDHCIFERKAVSKENNYSYGHWSSNGYFMFDQEELPWNDFSEPEGIGRGLEDTFQEEMAEKLATAGGGMVNGRGGTGKSHLIKLLKPKLEILGQSDLHCCYSCSSCQP